MLGGEGGGGGGEAKGTVTVIMPLTREPCPNLNGSLSVTGDGGRGGGGAPSLPGGGGLHQVAVAASSLVGTAGPQLAWPASLESPASCLLKWGPLSPLCGGWRDSRGNDGRVWVRSDLN